MKNVCAVVVTYNRKILLKESIDSILEQDCDNFDILIVDNHSSDGTYEYIHDMLNNPRLIYVDSGENIGGAGGFHLGIKKALEKGYEFVWLMDDDCVPRKNALSELLAEYELLADVGFLCSKVLWKDGSICQMNVPRYDMTHKVIDFEEKVIPISIATFVSILIPAKVIYDIGLPIKEFFVWTDDLEYTWRISKKYNGYLVTSSEVIHKMETNRGANIATDEGGRVDRYELAYRNEGYFYRREGVRGIIHILMRTPLHMLRVLAYSKCLRMKRLKVIVRGTLAGMVFNPKVEYIDK